MDPEALTLALRECLTRCQQVENLDPWYCQQRCDPAWTGADVGPYGIAVPRIEGPGFTETFVAGVTEDLRAVGSAAGTFLSTDLKTILLLVAIIAGLYLAIKVV